MKGTRLYGFCMTLILSACSKGQTTDEIYIAGFEYEDFRISCNGAQVDANELLDKMSASILAYVSEHEELAGSVGVIDYQKPGLVGYKKNGDDQLIQYLFSTYTRTDVQLPGEGGVNIVIDPCKESILHGSYFRFP